jgi:hypothetical protein
VIWTTQGLESEPLGTASLDFPVIRKTAESGRLPVLYAGSNDGKLYAVIVDTALDTNAPWPAAHHDARNSGNAGP